jgi:hypothetical protein
LNKILQNSRKLILLAASLACLLFIVAFRDTVKTDSKQLPVPTQNKKETLLRHVESSPEVPLRVVGNDDCPLRIVQATVKEISGAEFSQLTGRTTNLVAVSSVPEASLINASSETITGFVIALRDPYSRTTRGFVQQKIALAPGETYVVKREHFVELAKTTLANETGQVSHTIARPSMDSEKYWLQFAARSDIFVTIGQVTFNNGGTWLIKEGGEAK